MFNKLNERAETMPAAIVTAIMSTFILLSTAVIIGHVTTGKLQAAESLDHITLKNNMEVALQRDLERQQVVTATEDHLHFILDDEAICRESVWKVEPQADGTQLLTNTLYLWENADCSGKRSEKSHWELPVTNATFEATNPLGRDININHGEVIFLTEPATPTDGDARLTELAESAEVTSVSITSDNFQAFARV